MTVRALPALGYRPGLDGLRGLAIVLVLIGHAGFVRPQLANTGVTLFFVLSGFLITRLLIEERQRTGSVSLRAFYLRRARRLLPALFVMVPIVVALTGAWPGGLWALSYVGNWAQAAGNDIGPFGHTWSLAIEEQFYLVWPLAFLAVGRAVVVVPGVLVICLVARFAVPMDDHAMSYTTITQAPSLLAGVLLAFVDWPSIRWPVAWTIAGVALLGVAAYSPHVWMDPLAAIGAVLLLIPAFHGSFAWRPLMMLGTISYGVYLWQTPIFLLTGTAFAASVGSAGAAALATIIASASYFVVEQPIRRCRLAHHSEHRRLVRGDGIARG